MNEVTFPLYMVRERRFTELSAAIIAAEVLAEVEEKPIPVEVAECVVPSERRLQRRVHPIFRRTAIPLGNRNPTPRTTTPLMLDGREVFTTMGAAKFLANVDAITLAAWRQSGRKNAPAHFMNGKVAMYDKAELQAWKQRNAVAASSQLEAVAK